MLTDSETLQIMVAESNQAPLLEAIGPQQGAEGELIQFTAWGNDADIPPNTLRYQLRDGALAGASIDASTGEFQWLPGEAQGPGTYEVTVEVHDDGTPSLMDRAMMRITVAACPRPNNGDVNGDGVITPTDALSTILYFLCRIDLNEEARLRANVLNPDSGIPAADDRCIFRRFLQLLSCLD